MVSIGTLTWAVQVENAAQAKKDAQDVEESVDGAKEAMEEADDQTGGLQDKLGGLSEIQDVVGAGFDKMNAKAGFLGTAMSFVVGTISTLIGVLFSLKALVVGGLIAAVVGLAMAWKENIGDIQGRVEGFKEFIFEQFKAVKQTALRIWNRFLSGFKAGGGDMKDLKVLFIATLDGIEAGLKAFWAVAQPIWNSFVGVIVWAAGPIGKAVGAVVDVLAMLERKFGFVSKIISIVVAVAAAWAAWQGIVMVVGAIVSALGTLASIIGTVIGVIGTIVSAVGTFISIMSTVVSIVGTVIAALNPVTLIILAIIGVIVALYAAWKTNFLGIRDIVDDVVSTATSLFDSLMSKAKEAVQFIKDLFKGNIGRNIAEAFRSAFNGLIPNQVSIPSVTIGGGSFMGQDVPSLTIGGGSLDIPQLNTGGYVEQGGMAQLHAGEAVIPADVSRNMGLDRGGEPGMSKIEISVGGVEIGDQSLDIRNMSRTDLRTLAKEIANALGDDVRTVIP